MIPRAVLEWNRERPLPADCRGLYVAAYLRADLEARGRMLLIGGPS